MTSTNSEQLAEVVANLRGILFTRDTGLFPRDIEYDASVVVDWISYMKYHDSEMGLIINDIWQTLQGMPCCNVNFVSRKTNSIEFPPCIRKCLPKAFLGCV
ncbi:hypothetical protein Q3G72_015869 [Acer saccharum]|nr:hypothetical protein Q3G72_015869 [Acer saccharum]